jgi:hypothetical protein
MVDLLEQGLHLNKRVQKICQCSLTLRETRRGLPNSCHACHPPEVLRVSNAGDKLAACESI